ncbi:MAG: DUF302 domain-containing protein [Deltaproteobacteria bacterium]|nr:MAG: DUF302 domain-containing protein [Deltaproteobacteria bacterium]
MSPHYAITVDVPMPLPVARETVVSLLAAEGFGVLTEIDVQATLHAKLGVDTEPHVILGACAPQFAWQAIQAEEAIGVLLPCNVVLRELRPGHTRVFLTRVPALFTLVDNEAMAPIAAEVGARIERVAEELRGTSEA